MQIVDSFQNRLKEAMDYRNIKQVDLVEKTKLDKTLINKYLSGVSNAKQRKLTILAEALNVNEVWLLGYDVSMEREANTKIDKLGNPVVEIPILGTVKAGYDYLAQENWIGTIDIDKKLADGGEFFALKVKGDSMAPIFIEGDTVILRKQNDCENNQVAVVIINGDEGTLKKVKKTDDGIILQAYNPIYSPIFYTNKEIKEMPVVIAGVFQELRRTELKM
jgi:repressor LexA|nr:MAG TPA: Repressor protein CI [Caudoviricetes sp.]